MDKSVGLLLYLVVVGFNDEALIGDFPSRMGAQNVCTGRLYNIYTNRIVWLLERSSLNENVIFRLQFQFIFADAFIVIKMMVMIMMVSRMVPYRMRALDMNRPFRDSIMKINLNVKTLINRHLIASPSGISRKSCEQ